MAKCAVRRTPLRLRLWFYIVQGLTNALRKNSLSLSLSLSMANVGINFFYFIQYFSLVKAAMNAPRICKLGKNCLTDNDQCAMVLKTSQFIRFPINIFQVRNEFSPPLKQGGALIL
jgi:hypothetical protein